MQQPIKSAAYFNTLWENEFDFTIDSIHLSADNCSASFFLTPSQFDTVKQANFLVNKKKVRHNYLINVIMFLIVLQVLIVPYSQWRASLSFQSPCPREVFLSSIHSIVPTDGVSLYSSESPFISAFLHFSDASSLKLFLRSDIYVPFTREPTTTSTTSSSSSSSSTIPPSPKDHDPNAKLVTWTGLAAGVADKDIFAAIKTSLEENKAHG